MSTYWTRPSSIIQYIENEESADHISWNISDRFPLITSGSLIHIARSPKPDIKNKTYFLKFSHFNFENVPEIISGIELKLTIKRKGRITDETVQLYSNGLIGENKASLSLDIEKIYGGVFDKWDLNDISRNTVLDNNFGIVVRLQAHPKWPHKDHVIIDLVELRIH